MEEPRDLFARFDILPRSTDTWEQKLNSITRLVIVLTTILVVLKWKHWLTFFLVALILIVFVYLLKHQEGIEHPAVSELMENFNEGTGSNEFKYYKPRNSRSASSRPTPNRRAPLNSFAGQRPQVQANDSQQPVLVDDGQGFTHYVMPGVTLVPAKEPQQVQQNQQDDYDYDHGYEDQPQRPQHHQVQQFRARSKPRRKRKTAYEHAKDAWLQDVDEDEVARDRENLINSLR